MPEALKILNESEIIILKPYLDELAERIERPEYIDTDPISFMHAFSEKKDQELAGFFAALMAWGRRDIVIAKVNDLMSRMDYRPYEFIANLNGKDELRLEGFRHRTFNQDDVTAMVKILTVILHRYGSFESFWKSCHRKSADLDRELMAVFHEQFFDMLPEGPPRTRKHIASPDKNSSCKRLYLYLRWCIRKNSPVDPGIMNFLPASELMIPLDVHVARQARRLGLLSRKQNDWKAVLELTGRLKLLEPDDPARYDYALFGLGVLKIPVPGEFVVNDTVD